MSNKKETKLEKENRLLLAALKDKAPDQFKDSENGDSDGEPVFAVPDETDPAVIDKQDDYNEEQDRLQVSRFDKNRFVDQQSNLLLATNTGDTPSLQQINKSILNNDKPPLQGTDDIIVKQPLNFPTPNKRSYTTYLWAAVKKRYKRYQSLS